MTAAANAPTVQRFDILQANAGSFILVVMTSNEVVKNKLIKLPLNCGEQDLKLLLDWFSEHKDDKLNFIAKEAIKLEVKRANTVGDLLKTALNLLKIAESTTIQTV
jgi:transcriptional regulator of heat shock response